MGITDWLSTNPCALQKMLLNILQASQCCILLSPTPKGFSFRHAICGSATNLLCHMWRKAVEKSLTEAVWAAIWLENVFAFANGRLFVGFMPENSVNAACKRYEPSAHRQMTGHPPSFLPFAIDTHCLLPRCLAGCGPAAAAAAAPPWCHTPTPRQGVGGSKPH